MTVFVDFIYARGCSACKSCQHWVRIIKHRYPSVVVRWLDINGYGVEKMYKNNFEIDVVSANMPEDKKKKYLDRGITKLRGTPTTVVWTDHYPDRAYVVKYACAGRNVSLAEQEVAWEDILKKIDQLVKIDDGLTENPLYIVFKDMGWAKW